MYLDEKKIHFFVKKHLLFQDYVFSYDKFYGTIVEKDF